MSMLKRTETTELNTVLRPFGCRILRRQTAASVSTQKPPTLAPQRDIVALQSAEDSVHASAPAEKRHPCPVGKINRDGCCIYPLDRKAEGNWNYIIYNDCNPLKDLQLVFQVTKDMEAEYDLALK